MLDEHTAGDSLVEIHRQIQQFTESLGSQADIDAIRGKDEQIILQKLQNRVEHEGNTHRDPQHGEGGIALVHQHLIHHQLEEQRSHQPDGADGEHRQRYLAQQFLLPGKLRHKPQQTKGAVLIQQGEHALEEHHLAGKAGLVILPRNPFYCRHLPLRMGRRVPHPEHHGQITGFGCIRRGCHLAHAAEHHCLAFRSHGHAGVYVLTFLQRGPLHAAGAGGQPQVIRHLAQQAHAGLLLHRIFMQQAAHIRIQIMVAANAHQAVKHGVPTICRKVLIGKIAQETGLALPRFLQSRLLQENDFTAFLAQRVENSKMLFLTLGAAAAPQENHPVAVLQLQQNRRPEMGSQQIQVGIIPPFRLQAQFLQHRLHLCRRLQSGIPHQRLHIASIRHQFY